LGLFCERSGRQRRKGTERGGRPTLLSETEGLRNQSVIGVEGARSGVIKTDGLRKGRGAED